MARVYVIDDDRDLLFVIKSLLLKKGFDISVFSDWDEAEIAIKKAEPQLILLDVFLPGIDGMEVCQKLKRSPYTKHIPVLIFSAFPKIAESAIHDYGADDFIAKPFEVGDLVKKVRFVLSKKMVPA
ncbi:MAG TPA: response regulator [Chitinophagaceae bacterium]|nr:response regulator [Chitinophagaceae bacterium]